MESSSLIVVGIISVIVQYAIIYFAIRNGIERERKNQEIQIKLLSLIARKSGASEDEIQTVEGV